MKPLFFPTPDDLRSWFEDHHDQHEEIWIGYYKKSSGKASITWSESVDQAICFGWIDGIRKSINEECYKIRFTPRNSQSIWSAVNLEKIKTLTEQDLMHPAGIKVFEARDTKKIKKYSYERENATLGKDYEAQFKANPKAWKFFQSLPPYAQKQSIWYVISAKREDTRQRRLNTLIECSAQGLKIPQIRR